MERSDFHRLMERYVKGDITEQEKVKIETWLNVLKAENISDASLSKDEEDALFQRITNNIENVDEIVSFRPSSWKRKNRTTWSLGIAAGIIFISVFAFALLNRHDHKSTLEVVASGEMEKIILSDGSIAWLKKDSKLVYYEKPEENLRYSELVGEGLFEIAKDPAHPFIIQCGETTVRVVGTSFKLSTDNDQVSLWVLTGHVQVSSASLSQQIDVVANQKVVITSLASDPVSTIDVNERQSLIVNTDYNMLFDDTPLNVVFERLNQKFNVHVLADANSIKACKITADFTDHSLESSLTMISEITDLRYKKEGNQIVFQGEGCKVQ